MSSFNPSPFAPGHTPHLAGLDQTPLDDCIPTSPDATQFLQVSHRLSTSPAPSMRPSTSLSSFTEQASARSETENVRGSVNSLSSHLAAYAVHQPNNSPLSHVYTQPQHQSSPLAHDGPQFSVASTTDSQGPSPFTRQDHISPEENYGDYVLQRTQSFEEDFLNQPFGDLISSLVLDPEIPPSAPQDAPPVSPPVSDEHASQQDAWPTAYRPQGGSSATSYLLSPVPTSTGAPSPGLKRDNGESKGQRFDSPTLPTGATTATGRQETVAPVQISGQSSLHTPELSQGSRNSSGERLVAWPTQATVPKSNPAFKIENYGGGASTNPGPTIGQGPNPSSVVNRPSQTHLSPPLESAEHSQHDPNTRSLSPPVAEVARAEDGSWIPSPVNGQVGVDPTSREHLNEIYVPSLKEQEEQRQLEEKKAHVEHWLVESANPGVPADQPVPVPRLSVRKSADPSRGRPRARSTGDMACRVPDPVQTHVGVTPEDDSGIPGPGALLEVQSDYDDDDDEMDDMESNTEDEDDTTPPAPPRLGEVDEEPPTDYFAGALEGDPDPTQFIRPHPWVDHPSKGGPTETHMQPFSSNAAIMRFKQRADNIETASRVATWGTRRMSDTAVEQLVRQPTTFKRLSFGKDKDKNKVTGDKKGLLEVKKFLKRKNSEKSVSDPSNHDSTDKTRKESVPTLVLSKSSSSSSKLPKPLKVNTGANIVAATAGQVAALGGGGSFSAKPVSSPTSTWKNVIRRTRSRSDLTRKSDSMEIPTPSLSTLMAQVGGPPVPTLASPPREPEATKPTFVDDDDEEENDEDDLMEGEGVEMDLTVRSGPIIPTLDGFRAQVKQLNPRLEQFLVERVSQEQLRRYRRLVDCKLKHHRAVQAGKCSSNSGSHRYCPALGGGARILPSKASQRELGASSTDYRLATAVPPVEGTDRSGDGSVASAQFPRGVPLPPAKRLPAELECPLCFKVKKFHKPSDWTKHVHEDVEPFTCTFPNCSEPKSFKRKADWVRHENEKHRQLEWWTCNLQDCNHTCYRKDNFLQHLVREHKKPEPKVKTTKRGAKGSAASKVAAGNGDDGKVGSCPRADSTQEEINKLWALVEACRHNTPKVPRDEPCKFCGNVCSSWKKLTVHLAKHMQQISLPVLGLVEQYNVNEGTHMGGMGQGISSQMSGSLVGSMPGSKMEPGMIGSTVMPSSNIPTNGAGGLGYGFQVGAAQAGSGNNRQPMASYGMQGSQYTGPIPFHRASYPGQSYASSAYPPQPRVAQSSSLAAGQIYARQPNSMSQAVFTNQQGASAYPSTNGMTSAVPESNYCPPFNSQQQYVNSTLPSNGNPYIYVPSSSGNFPAGSNGGSYGNVNGNGYEGGAYMSNNQPTHHPY